MKNEVKQISQNTEEKDKEKTWGKWKKIRGPNRECGDQACMCVCIYVLEMGRASNKTPSKMGVLQMTPTTRTQDAIK